jgi:hypothetical protein
MDQWLTIVNTARNLWILWVMGISLLEERMLASQEWSCPFDYLLYIAWLCYSLLKEAATSCFEGGQLRNSVGTLRESTQKKGFGTGSANLLLCYRRTEYVIRRFCTECFYVCKTWRLCCVRMPKWMDMAMTLGSRMDSAVLVTVCHIFMNTSADLMCTASLLMWGQPQPL